MKKIKSLNIFVLAIALVIAQACGSKSEKTIEGYGSTDTSISAATATTEATVLSAEEKRAKIETERAARAEKRRIEIEERAKTTPYYTDSEGNIVYNKAEIDPVYNGGDEAMMKYLQDNLKFPEEARKKGIEGTVFVDFIVNSKGAVREIAVTDSIDGEMDQSFRNEAVRVVSGMPKWIPGSQKGKPVQVKFSLPITFRLE